MLLTQISGSRTSLKSYADPIRETKSSERYHARDSMDLNLACKGVQGTYITDFPPIVKLGNDREHLYEALDLVAKGKVRVMNKIFSLEDISNALI